MLSFSFEKLLGQSGESSLALFLVNKFGTEVGSKQAKCSSLGQFSA